ncbi:sensor histidine kinase [Paenibacillus chartarius]|uniref:histidine kinase n=1 Tax=Paenibacillus chartarius TaxID=747481 RepID=A0ABV6DEI3_9BACL
MRGRRGKRFGAGALASRIALPVAILFAAWAAAQYGLWGLYSWLDARPPEWIASFITLLTAMSLIVLTVGLLGFVFKDRRRNMFDSLIESIRRIGRGQLDEPIALEEVHVDWPMAELLASINTMTSELSQMEKMRQEFISNVSHEFQSPLTSIGGFARTLRRDDLSAEERERYLDIIEKECARLSRLSDNLLKLTSLESEHQPVKKTEYRLDRQLRDIVLSAEPQWAGKGLDVEAGLEEHLTVTADEELMSQVWTNLLHNAVKFTPPGGMIRVEAVTVRAGEDGWGGGPVEGEGESGGIGRSVSGAYDNGIGRGNGNGNGNGNSDGHANGSNSGSGGDGGRGSGSGRGSDGGADAVRVTFADTGVGLSAEQQQHVFERFYKADRSRHREHGGSGLGLAIVRKIVELHGGTVAVSSAPGEGAAFTVTLPLSADGDVMPADRQVEPKLRRG